MPWVWSDELATRLVDEGFLMPGELDDFAPIVASKVDDPDDAVAAARAVFGLELNEALAS